MGYFLGFLRKYAIQSILPLKRVPRETFRVKGLIILVSLTVWNFLFSFSECINTNYGNFVGTIDDNFAETTVNLTWLLMPGDKWKTLIRQLTVKGRGKSLSLQFTQKKYFYI